jgi:hypothetical protein
MRKVSPRGEQQVRDRKAVAAGPKGLDLHDGLVASRVPSLRETTQQTNAHPEAAGILGNPQDSVGH